MIGKTYIQQIRDESIYNTCDVFEYLCDETKQKKRSFFLFFLEKGQISAPLFLFFYLEMCSNFQSILEVGNSTPTMRTLRI